MSTLCALLLLSIIGTVTAFPTGAPTLACGMGLNNVGVTIGPLIPKTDVVYGQGGLGQTYYVNSSLVGNGGTPTGVTHMGYPSGSTNMTIKITDANGKPVTVYTPGATYKVVMNYTQPICLGCFGFEGFLMGAMPTAAGATGGGGAVSVVSVTTLNNVVNTNYAKSMPCPGLDAFATHTVYLFADAQGNNNGGKALQATWTAPATDKGTVALQVGLVTGVPGDPYLGSLMTMNIMSPTSNNALVTDGGAAAAAAASMTQNVVFVASFAIIFAFVIFMETIGESVVDCLCTKKAPARGGGKV